MFARLQVLGRHRGSLYLAAAGRRRASTNSTGATDDVSQRNRFYDVVIAGGGMVGTAMACALGTSPKFVNKRVLLLDAKRLTSDHQMTSTYSNRVSALSPKSRTFMEDIGVWDNICNMRQRPVKFMHVMDACSDAFVRFAAPDNAVHDNIFYTVENNVTHSALMRRLDKLSADERVVVEDEVRIRNYEIPTTHDQGLVKLHKYDGEVIETKLLIGSDGANSTIIKTANIQSIAWNYNQSSLVATLHLSPENEDNNTAWQRFLPNGTIAILPLTETLSSLVWSANVPFAKRLMAMTDEEFVAEVNMALFSDADTNRYVASLTKSVNNILRNATQSELPAEQVPPKVTGIDLNSRVSYNLRMGHATQYVAPRLALIGDAVHQVHPHAGQGANLGFGDVLCLRNILDDTVSCGSDIGSLDHLVLYERARQREAVPIVTAIDLLHRHFTSDWTPIVAFRGLGMGVVSSCPALKNFLMRQVN